MSDQASDLGSNDGAQQGPQQGYVQVEGINSMGVKVTNIVDGFFRFYSARSQSGGGSSSGMSDSGRNSGRSSPANLPPSTASGASGSSSIFRQQQQPSAASSATSDRPKPTRRASSKKTVKFKEDHPPPLPATNKKTSFFGFGTTDDDTDTPDTNDSPSSSRPMDSVLDADEEAAKLYMDESTWYPESTTRTSRRGGMEGSRRNSDSSSRNNNSPSSLSSSQKGGGRKRRDRTGSSSSMNRSMNRSSKRRGGDGGDSRGDTMDASVSSRGSWNINLDGGGGQGSAPYVRTVSSFEKAGCAGPIDFTSLEAKAKAADDDSNKKPMWFERYMPNWLISLRAFCGMIVMDDRFQILMVLLISANAICMGIATFDFVEDSPPMASLFERIDFIFLCIFTVELALQFGYWGYQVFTDGWLCFDFITVVTSWVFQDSGVQVFRSFRVFRAFRLVVRIPILKSLVYAVLHVMPRISSIMGLFALLTYIYAVMATTLYKDYYELGYTSLNYFGRLDYSLFTLFQFVTLENWADIVREVAKEDYFANIIFCSFLTISGFILYSLVVAVVCDSFLMVESQIRKELQEEAKAARERRKLLKRRKGKRHIDDDDDDRKGKGDDTSNVDNSLAWDSDGSLGALDDSDLELEELDRQMAVSSYNLKGSRTGEGPTDSRRRNDPTPEEEKPGWVENSFLKRTEMDIDITGIPNPYMSPEDEKYAARHRHGHGQERERRVPRHERRRDQEVATNEEIHEQQPYANDTIYTTNVKTLAVGDMERKKGTEKKRKRKPVKHRIKRVQKRLDKLSAAQSEILATLDSMTREMEKRNGILEASS